MGTWTSSGPVRRPASRTRAVSSAARSTRSVGTPKARPAAASPRAARRRRPARRRWLGPPRPSPRSVDGRHGDRRDACRASPGLVPGRAPGGVPGLVPGRAPGGGPWPRAGSGAGRGSLASCRVGRRAGVPGLVPGRAPGGDRASPDPGGWARHHAVGAGLGLPRAASSFGPPRSRAEGRSSGFAIVRSLTRRARRGRRGAPAWAWPALPPSNRAGRDARAGWHGDARAGWHGDARAGWHGTRARGGTGRARGVARGRPCGAPRARVGLVRARVGLARDGPRVRLAGCASPQQPP